MAYCKQCGASVDEVRDTACPYCGNVIEKAPQPAPQYQNNQYGNPYQNNQYGNPYQNNQFGGNPYQNNPYGNQFSNMPFANQYQYNGDSIAIQKANSAKVLGILAIFINPMFIMSIIAIVMSNQALTLAPNNPEVQTSAKTAKSCAIIAIVVGMFLSIASILMLANMY